MKIKTVHILISALVILLLIGGSYAFVSYQNKERETKILLTDQQKALRDAQQKIADIQKSNEQGKQTQATAQKNANNKANQDSIITSEVDPLLTGVVEILCGATNGHVQGSGSLWKIANKYVVLTNAHVVSSSYSDGHCEVFIHDQTDKSVGAFKIYPANARSWNSKTDVAILDLMLDGTHSLDMATLNYNISYLDLCPSTISVGAPVTIIGYPAFTQTTSQPFNSQGDTYSIDARTVTNGVVSAYDTSQSQIYGSTNASSLPYQNYFVSNRIDHGSSGGVALSKNNGNLCILGIPTWLNQGVSDNQGIVQNINNVMHVGN